MRHWSNAFATRRKARLISGASRNLVLCRRFHERRHAARNGHTDGAIHANCHRVHRVGLRICISTPLAALTGERGLVLGQCRPRSARLSRKLGWPRGIHCRSCGIGHRRVRVSVSQGTANFGNSMRQVYRQQFGGDRGQIWLRRRCIKVCYLMVDITIDYRSY